MNTNNYVHKKLILRYAVLIAKGDAATETEKQEMNSIEDQLHLTKDTILRQATEFGLAAIK